MLLTQITEIISKNINAIEADVITKELQRLQKVEESSIKTTEKLKELEIKYTDVCSQILVLKEQETHNINLAAELESKQADINQRIASLVYSEQIVKLREEFATTRVQDHKDMLKIVFKNNYIAKDIFTNISEYDSNTGRNTNRSNNTTETSRDIPTDY